MRNKPTPNKKIKTKELQHLTQEEHKDKQRRDLISNLNKKNTAGKKRTKA